MKETGQKQPIRILYFYTRDATFIRKDVALLRTRFEVQEHSFPAPEKWKTPLLFLTQLWFLMQHSGFGKRQVMMIQFAGYHSFLPCLWARIFGKKSMVVVGGTDCVAFPSLGYGHFQNPLLAFFTRWTYRLCDVVSAVHESLFYREDHYQPGPESKQGIFQFVSNTKFRKNVIYNGFDAQQFRITKAWQDRPPLTFISISASLTDPVRMKLKGIDMVISLAAKIPEARFTLVGSERNSDHDLPQNVILLPFVPNSALPELYNEHRFYLQLSISEGFPNALCEAMACGCIPIVSAVASMPEIVGNMGTILHHRNPDEILEAVKNTIIQSGNQELSTRISSSIADRFSLESRCQKLLLLIEETIEKP